MSLLISFLLKALEILLWDGIIIKNVVNHITKSRIRLLIIKKSLEKYAIKKRVNNSINITGATINDILLTYFRWYSENLSL